MKQSLHVMEDPHSSVCQIGYLVVFVHEYLYSIVFGRPCIFSSCVISSYSDFYASI
jgi:hypothetical protein